MSDYITQEDGFKIRLEAGTDALIRESTNEGEGAGAIGGIFFGFVNPLGGCGPKCDPPCQQSDCNGLMRRIAGMVEFAGTFPFAAANPHTYLSCQWHDYFLDRYLVYERTYTSFDGLYVVASTRTWNRYTAASQTTGDSDDDFDDALTSDPPTTQTHNTSTKQQWDTLGGGIYSEVLKTPHPKAAFAAAVESQLAGFDLTDDAEWNAHAPGAGFFTYAFFELDETDGMAGVAYEFTAPVKNVDSPLPTYQSSFYWWWLFAGATVCAYHVQSCWYYGQGKLKRELYIADYSCNSNPFNSPANSYEVSCINIDPPNCSLGDEFTPPYGLGSGAYGEYRVTPGQC